MLFLLIISLISAFAKPIHIDKSCAKSYVGVTVSICDTVSHVSVPDGTSRPYIIYFEEYNGRFSGNNYLFNGIIWNSSIGEVEMNPKAELSGKDICINGVISSYNGTPQIVITSPEQISVIHSKAIGVK
jgi:hypothetical protein